MEVSYMFFAVLNLRYRSNGRPVYGVNDTVRRSSSGTVTDFRVTYETWLENESIMNTFCVRKWISSHYI